MSTSCTPHPSRVASDFFRFIEEEDMAGVMSLLGPEFQLRDGDGSVLAARSDMPAMLGWDFEADPGLEVGEMRVSGDTVRLTVVEQNDFTRLLHLGGGASGWGAKLLGGLRAGDRTDPRLGRTPRSGPARRDRRARRDELRRPHRPPPPGRGDGLHWDHLDAHASLTGLMVDALNLREWAPRIMGQTRSEAKARAARANGLKGGRPRKSAKSPTRKK